VQRAHRTIVADERDGILVADVEALEHRGYGIAAHHALFAHEVLAIIDDLGRWQLDRLDDRTQFERTGLGARRDSECSSHAEQRDRCQQRPSAPAAGRENLFR
jgi:hypothetical protein